MAVTYVLPIGAWIGIVVVCLMIVFVIVIMTSNNVTPRPPPPPFNPVDVTVTTEAGTFEAGEPVEGTLPITVTTLAGENQVVLNQDPNDPYTLNSTSVNTVLVKPDPETPFEYGQSYTMVLPMHIANQTSPDYVQDGDTTGTNNFFTTTSYSSSEPVGSSDIRGSLILPISNIRTIMFSRAEGEVTLTHVKYVATFPEDTIEALEASNLYINTGTKDEPNIIKPSVPQYRAHVGLMNTSGVHYQTTVNTKFKATGPCSS